MIRSVVLLLLFARLQSLAQQKTLPAPGPPRLVVGIVVDQMRNEFVYRYWNRFSDYGFRKLFSEGHYFRNTHYNYVPTYTGPGHASIYTGATPRQHGIVGNDWFDIESGQNVYCCYDGEVKGVGAAGDAGKASPFRLRSSTLTDELKMCSPQSKVFGISLKDRSAIFPAGHAANAAFWLEESSGYFITSTFYSPRLPAWVEQFNKQNKTRAYLENGWATLHPIATYSASTADSTRYEASLSGGKTVFPYSFAEQLKTGRLGYIKNTPYGNSLVKDLALQCIAAEKLGEDAVPDFLALSFSSSDIIGHAFGPRSVEVEDMYLRLDRDIGELLHYLDNKVGKGNYLVFLTADHGVAEVPNFLKDHGIPAGNLHDASLRSSLRQFFKENYGDSTLLRNLSNAQLYLDENVLTNHHLDRGEVIRRVCGFLRKVPGIAEVYTSEQLATGSYLNHDLISMLRAGHHPKLGGDVCFVYEAGWHDSGEKGSTHGSGYTYDTHVPLVFFGSGIRKGETFDYVSITQIAPTLAELLRISRPAASFAEPLNAHLR